MDGLRFDELTKTLSGSTTRRRVAGALLGAALAALDAGGTCREHANCCCGLCGAKDATGRRRCECQGPDDCPAPPQCHAATCTGGVCEIVVTPHVACDDGNPCTEDDVCRGAPADCSSIADQCNDGVCRAADGVCVKQPKTDDTVCETGNLCTADTCRGGVCTEGPDVVTPTCAASDTCHEAGACDPATGACTPEQPIACGACNVCSGGICVPADEYACMVAFDFCGDFCGCAMTASGLAGCFDLLTEMCEEHPRCGDDGSCPAGRACMVDSCCGEPVCVLTCGAARVTQARVADVARPTAGRTWAG